jgi:phosphoglycolate phosphatase-like HAD superfamily hydrolase
VGNSLSPDLLALDFDGVLCDGRAEYLESSWRVYREIWQNSDVKLDQIKPRFYQLRSVIETGWEMPLLLRALKEGISDVEIRQDWSSLVQWILEKEGVSQEDLARLLDEKRDRWIESDLEDWLAHHEFYPGVIARVQAILNQQTTQVYIITTKEGRFARKLLEQHGISFPGDQIIGKECKQPKADTITRLLPTDANLSLWFVEDRLKTLLSLEKYPHLEAVRLFLAEWGYNTARSRTWARANQKIQLLSLDQFNQDFSHW